MKPLRIQLRIVFHKEQGNWIANCLELDVLGHARTRKDALKMLTQAILIQIEASIKYNNPRNLFTPADGKYFAMFAAGKDSVVDKLDLVPVDPVTIEEITTREYSGSDAEFAFA